MKRLAVVDDDAELREIVAELCESLGHQVLVFADGLDFLEAAQTIAFDAVLCDMYMEKSFGLNVLRDFTKGSAAQQGTAFIIMTGANKIDFIEEAVKLSRVHLLQKPFSEAELSETLQRAFQKATSLLEDVFASVNHVTGVRLGQESHAGLESRVLRRARLKGFANLEEYAAYFNVHRKEEMEAIIGLLTTHTTSFFREPDHFRILESQILPAIVSSRAAAHHQKGKVSPNAESFAEGDVLKIWSAACSTGPEVYSLAITCAEFLPRLCSRFGIPELDFTVMGSDIDKFSLEVASEGVYSAADLEELPKHLKMQYFIEGNGELAGYFKVKNSLWKKCSFKKHNLLDHASAVEKCDVVFLRNVLIYFSKQDTNKIIDGLVKKISPGGYLFVGHTESGAVVHPLLKLHQTGVFERLSGAKAAPSGAHSLSYVNEEAVHFERLEDSEQLRAASASGHVRRLVVVGSSTGGTQALRQALAGLKQGSFPPVLVTQHFPEGFTQAFARNLAHELGVAVVVAQDGMRLQNDKVFLCPGRHHMHLDEAQIVRISEALPEEKLSPEIDRLFFSVASHCQKLQVLALVLTGMGNDGAKGLLALKNLHKKVTTLTESEETAVVYGMPKAAFELGASQHHLPLHRITSFVSSWISADSKKSA